jgi:predicted dienelactone hydrolase
MAQFVGYIGGAVAAAGLLLKVGSSLAELANGQHSILSRRQKKGSNRPMVSCEAMAPNTFVNKDRLRIYFRAWLPQSSPPLGLVIIAHGFGEHIGRYEHIAGALTRAGFVVYGLDHQGHGRSEGDRAFVVRFSDYADDVLQLTELAQSRHPALARRTFLLGASSGERSDESQGGGD